MPEVILPCPNQTCGSKFVMTDTSPSGADIVKCCTCFMHGPYSDTEESAIAAWNALPRALPWTYDPPKVAGKYWWRPVGKKIGRIRDIFVRNGEVGFLDRNDRFITDIDGVEWAGPIAPPVD